MIYLKQDFRCKMCEMTIEVYSSNSTYQLFFIFDLCFRVSLKCCKEFETIETVCGLAEIVLSTE